MAVHHMLECLNAQSMYLEGVCILMRELFEYSEAAVFQHTPKVVMNFSRNFSCESKQGMSMLLKKLIFAFML